MNISDLTGNRLKKDLGLRRCLKRWHNHNKSGGNFGINLYTVGGKNFELIGEHDTEGKIYNLRFSILWGGAGVRIINRELGLTMEYDEMIDRLNKAFKKGDV